MADPLDIYHPSSNYPFDQEARDTFGQPATDWTSPSLYSPGQETWNHVTASPESDGGHVYDMSLPFSDLDFADVSFPELGDVGQRASPTLSSDNGDNSPTSSISSSWPSSSTPHLECRRLTKEDIQSGKFGHGVVHKQT